MGDYIKQQWKILAKKYSLPIKISGLSALATFYIDTPNRLKYKTYITQEMLKSGVITNNSIYVCIHHKKKDINFYLKVLNKCFKNIALFEKNQNIDEYLNGPVCQTFLKTKLIVMGYFELQLVEYYDKNFEIIEPSNLKKFTHKNPEKVLFDNLYKKFGDLSNLEKDEDNVKNLDMLKVEPYPNTVILELVNRCNLECVMCYQGFRNDAKKSTLDEKILDKIFQILKKII